MRGQSAEEGRVGGSAYEKRKGADRCSSSQLRSIAFRERLKDGEEYDRSSRGGDLERVTVGALTIS